MQRRSRGLLTALRAAAIVVIATGLNDVLAGAIPRYEPLYLFLAAVALVVLLDGVAVGALAALLAGGFHVLLFLPRRDAETLAFPLGALVAALLLAALIRVVFRAIRRRPPEPELLPRTPPLLEAPAVAAADHTEVLSAIDDLRAELYERESAHAEVLATVQASAEEVRRTLEQTRVEHERDLAAARAEGEARGHEARAMAAVADELRADLRAVRTGADELRRSLDIERARAEGERTLRTTAVERVTELEKALSAARARAAELEQAAADERTLRERLESALTTLRARASQLEQSLETARLRAADEERALREDAARTAAAHERELGGLREVIAQLEPEAGRVGELEVDLDVARGRIALLESELEARTSALQAESAREAELGARIAQLESDLAGAVADREEARGEARRASERIASLESDLDARTAALRTESAREEELGARIVQLESDLAGAVADREEARGEARRANERIASLESDLESRTSALQAESAREAELGARIAQLETDLAGAVADRDEARGEARRAIDRIASLESDLEARTAALRTESAREAELGARIASLETDLRNALADRDDARAEARTLTDRIASLESDLEARMIALRNRSAREAELETRVTELEADLTRERATFDDKLNTIAMHLAQDHEADLGKAFEEKEEARAEARSLAMRVHALEAEVAKASAEFDQKLNTIVSHLAQDHEADLGKALEEKEEARAEARSLSMRLTALQKKVDEERQAILAKLHEADERNRHALEDSTRLLSETRAAAQAEIDRLQARIAELEGPKTPPSAPKPRILVAHPDAEMRRSARASLERAGYEIVSAADGLEALRTAIAQRPDIVIADAVMPKMDGRELCQLLKSQEKTAHIRVILLTRATDEPPRGELPPDEVLFKPVPLETLKATLATLLGAKAPADTRS